jgi:hypothetical protein
MSYVKAIQCMIHSGELAPFKASRPGSPPLLEE